LPPRILYQCLSVLAIHQSRLTASRILGIKGRFIGDGLHEALVYSYAFLRFTNQKVIHQYSSP